MLFKVALMSQYLDVLIPIKFARGSLSEFIRSETKLLWHAFLEGEVTCLVRTPRARNFLTFIFKPDKTVASVTGFHLELTYYVFKLVCLYGHETSFAFWCRLSHILARSEPSLSFSSFRVK